MRIIYSLFLFMAGCFWHPTPMGEKADMPLVLVAPVIKQKEKVETLHKKLQTAEEERAKAHAEVNRLQKEIEKAELHLVRKQVESYEKQIHALQRDPQKYLQFLQCQKSSLFLPEREMLHQMIQQGSPLAASEAQIVLDRILRMITELSDDVVSH